MYLLITEDQYLRLNMDQLLPQQKQINQKTATLMAQITADISHRSDDL